MTDHKQDLDINEAFENLLFAEEIAQNLGYTEGYEAGKSLLANGYHLGYHRASLIAAQLGYYCGILEQYLTTNKAESKRAVSIANELLQDISRFPRTNVDNTDILKTMESIKFKYAKFCALAKISSSYPEVEKFDF